MRNIPLFTTDAGAAGLVLEEIPYKKEAYIRIHSSAAPLQLVEECVGFCRAAGAERIYATGHECLSQYPLHTKIWKMSCLRSKLPAAAATLVPVQQNTLDQWRDTYNERMASVPNSATMTARSAHELLQSGNGYFVYQGDTLLGIGKASEDTVEAIISVIQGRGKDVLLALCSVLTADEVAVVVASENVAAVRLYQKLGFKQIAELSRWYCV